METALLVSIHQIIYLFMELILVIIFNSTMCLCRAISNVFIGLNMTDGSLTNMQEEGINECYRVKEQALHSASEAAEMILRVDEIVRCAPRKRDQY